MPLLFCSNVSYCVCDQSFEKNEKPYNKKELLNNFFNASTFEYQMQWKNFQKNHQNADLEIETLCSPVIINAVHYKLTKLKPSY